jgi:hypothetical protein
MSLPWTIGGLLAAVQWRNVSTAAAGGVQLAAGYVVRSV